MARNTTLGQLVTMFRDEAGHASSAALGQNALSAIHQILRRTQRRLWTEWTWPHLMVERDESLQAGERYYSFPDLDPDRIQTVVVREDTASMWVPVAYGIELCDRNEFDAEKGDRSDPVRKWQYSEDGQYEVWPTPDSNRGVLRFSGMRQLRPLVADSDRADLDDDLIVLYAAGQWLKKQKDPSAPDVIAQAEAHFRRLKGNSQRASVFRIQDTQPGYTGITIPRGPRSAW